MFNFFFKLSRAVTIIESLLVIGIMGILLVLTVPALRKFNLNQTLKVAALGVKTDLRLAQDNAISGKVIETSSQCGKNEFLAGWYVAFSTSVTNSPPNNKWYYLKGICVDGNNNLKTVLDGKRVKLPSEVVIGNINVNGNRNTLYVFFKNINRSTSAPFVLFLEDVCQNVGDSCPGTIISAASTAKITLTLAGAGSYKVNITSSGAIYESR